MLLLANSSHRSCRQHRPCRISSSHAQRLGVRIARRKSRGIAHCSAATACRRHSSITGFCSPDLAGSNRMNCLTGKKAYSNYQKQQNNRNISSSLAHRCACPNCLRDKEPIFKIFGGAEWRKTKGQPRGSRPFAPQLPLRHFSRRRRLPRPKMRNMQTSIVRNM